MVSININYTNIKDLKKLISPGSFINVATSNSDLSLGTVNISGEVNQPGNYRILKGDTIFTILKRAGGLSENAFMEGLIFSREEEKTREKKSLLRLKRDLEKAIATAVERQSSKISITKENISALRDLASAASDVEPIGRVVGNFTTLKVLKTNIVSGDKIFIPKTPTSVTLVGEVMAPGSVLWEKNKDVNDYIKSAAGFRFSKYEKVFVITPNGKAQKQSGLYSSNEIRPGSTIVIPRN